MPLPVLPVLLVGGLVLFSGMKPSPKKTGKQRPLPPLEEPTPELEEAVAFCQSQGGEVVDYETTDGEIVAVCAFPDGRMAEALAYYRGEAAPDCPVGMLFDQTTGECVPAGGPDVPDSPDEALQFVMCTSLYTQAWRPWTPESYALDPAVAANLSLIMYGQAKRAEENNKGYSRPEPLADLGMTHVVPQCDWVAYRGEVAYYQDQGMPLPMTEAEANKVDEIFESVVGLAKEVLEMVWLEAEQSPGQQGGMAQTPQQQQQQQGGGMHPNQALCPVGYFYDALHDVCCPDGFYWNVDEQTCRPMGYAGTRRQRRRNVDAIRHSSGSGYAGGCGGRRGHCGVRPRS